VIPPRKRGPRGIPEPTESGVSDVTVGASTTAGPPRVIPVNRPRHHGEEVMLEDVPDADDFEVQEGTPITDMGSLFKKMTKTAMLVENVSKRVAEQSAHVRKIPEVIEKSDRAWKAANETREEVIIVRTRQEDQSKRLERMENTGHSCRMVERIESIEKQAEFQADDRVKDALVRQQVATIAGSLGEFQKDRKEMEKERRSLRNTIIGIAVTVVISALGSGGGAIWFVRGLQADLQLEVQARELRDQNLDKQLSKIPTREQLNQRLPSEHDVQQLTKAIETHPSTQGGNRDSEIVRAMFDGLPRSKQLDLCRNQREALPDYVLESCPH
jgi:hypothetical protein